MTTGVEATFWRLSDRWHEETGGHSNPRIITGNTNYQQIIALGKPAIPLILRDLRDRGGDWYAALRELTGASPTKPESRGKVRLMKQEWFAWAEEHGYELAPPRSSKEPRGRLGP